MTDLASLVTAARHDFSRRYGALPQWIVAAPGRANLIGDHTDYNDGFCLPFAIDRHTVLCAAPASAAGRIEIASSVQDQPSTVELKDPIDRVGDWSDYLRGVLQGYQQRGTQLPAIDVVCHSNLPIGAGLSSSASLEVATALLVERISGLELDTGSRIRLCQQAEHDYAGVPCGLLDQFAVSQARAGHLMLFDARALTAQQVPFGSDQVALLVIDSAVDHALADSEYATRRAECERAVEQLGCSLRDAELEQVSGLTESTLRRRARHVVTENQRVHALAKALTDERWSDAGELMFASHASLRDDYQVSCAETDTLVEIAAELDPIYGARMTGGGFGGSVIALVDAATTADVIADIRAKYLAQTGIATDGLIVRPVNCAHVIDTNDDN